ncbi:MAG: hypothetical protein CL608_27270 [Anaerolineaceae bacterium]|nr:hypothetical protein [Anaerolineaceae bacterium]
MKQKPTLVIFIFLLLLLAACSGVTDETTSSPATISTIFWAVAGLMAVGIGIFLPQFNRLMGMPDQEERFTVPKFKRTAELNGRIARAVLILLGFGMLVNGIGPYILPPSVVTIAGYTLLVLAFLGILLMIIITTGNWRV